MSRTRLSSSLVPRASRQASLLLDAAEQAHGLETGLFRRQTLRPKAFDLAFEVELQLGV
jgi:hypothetical protein